MSAPHPTHEHLRLAWQGSALTVGFYSPLPPAPTGVADYAAVLLEGLRRHGRIEVNARHCDVPLYHLGNNALHAEIYRRAVAEPGVVVLHDAVLNHLLLGQLDEAKYVDEFVYNYGEWHRGLGQDLWRRRAGSGSESRYFDWPMLRRIAGSARAVVVHNPAAAQAVRRHAPEARVLEIPHLFAMPCLPSDGEVWRYRQRLGVSPGAFLFGIFGYLRETKRLMTALETFAALQREAQHARLLVAGPFASSGLERAAAALLCHPGVVRLPYLPEQEFWLAARAVDACINLRYPSTGETSGISIRLMGIGKPVMMTESEEVSGFPEDACLRVAGGLEEKESLWRHMMLLTSIPEAAREIGRRGAEHIRLHHRMDEIAARYWAFLSEL